MNDDDITMLLTRQVRASEPPFALDANIAMARGHRMRTTRRRRHVALATAGVLVTYIGVTAGISNLNSTQEPEFASPGVASNYDAAAMPEVMRQVAEERLGSYLQGLTERFEARPEGHGTPLAPENYAQASSMELSYSDDSEHHLSISIAHAGSEAEGDPEKVCESLRASSWGPAIPSCEVSEIDGHPVITQVTINTPPSPTSGQRLWKMLPLARPEAVAAQGPNLYFTRSVKVVRSATLVTSVREVVYAPTLAEAETRFTWSADELTTLAGDPRLTIPLAQEASAVPHNPQGAMTIAPAAPQAGDDIEVRFPPDNKRGIAFSLSRWDDDRWVTTYYLTSDGNPMTHEPDWWAADSEDRGWVDIGVSGSGPDRLVIPASAMPGDYRLCTANAADESCATLTIAP